MTQSMVHQQKPHSAIHGVQWEHVTGRQGLAQGVDTAAVVVCSRKTAERARHTPVRFSSPATRLKKMARLMKAA